MINNIYLQKIIALLYNIMLGIMEQTKSRLNYFPLLRSRLQLASECLMYYVSEKCK